MKLVKNRHRDQIDLDQEESDEIYTKSNHNAKEYDFNPEEIN